MSKIHAKEVWDSKSRQDFHTEVMKRLNQKLTLHTLDEFHPSENLLEALRQYFGNTSPLALRDIVCHDKDQIVGVLTIRQNTELKALLANKGLYLGMTPDHMKEAFGE